MIISARDRFLKYSSMSRPFPAKLLLFGEYSVLAGSDVCAFPFSRFSGRLEICDLNKDATQRIRESNESLKKLLDYLATPENYPTTMNMLDAGRMAEDIHAGLAFLSDIPLNYGLGSSGALVAALYDRYKKENKDDDLTTVHRHLAFIESAFHAKSSGTDPLVSYLNRPVFIRSGEIECPDLKFEKIRENIGIELIDSGMPGVTKVGVGAFQSGNLIQPSEKMLFAKEYVPLVNSIIGHISTEDYLPLIDEIFRLSELQLVLFPWLFTPDMLRLARQGLAEREFALKLCGSGGGGYYLKIKVKQG